MWAYPASSGSSQLGLNSHCLHFQSQNHCLGRLRMGPRGCQELWPFSRMCQMLMIQLPPAEHHPPALLTAGQRGSSVPPGQEAPEKRAYSLSPEALRGSSFEFCLQLKAAWVCSLSTLSLQHKHRTLTGSLHCLVETVFLFQMVSFLSHFTAIHPHYPSVHGKKMHGCLYCPASL